MTTVTRRFSYSIKPNKLQQDLLVRSFGCCRFIWNECLAKYQKAYEEHKANPKLPCPKPDFKYFNDLLNQLKSEYEWLYEVSAVALQQVTRSLAKAFSNFFRELKKGKLSYPRFKNKHGRNSFTLMDNGFKFNTDRLSVIKSKIPIKVRMKNKFLPSPPSSCTIIKDPDGRYRASFVCQDSPHVTNGQGKIGIDVGLTDFATINDGSVISNPRYFVSSQKKLKCYQQSLSRKQKGSNNRNKARIKVARLHKKISNQRNDFLHKLSRKLVNENQVIGIETLKIQNMVKNRHLAKAVNDVSWGKFFSFLTYKANESYHCNVILMHPYYPSTQLCSHCHKRPIEKLTLSIRKWTCDHCGTNHDRDFNAANNIRDKAVDTFHNQMGSQWHMTAIQANKDLPCSTYRSDYGNAKLTD